MAIAMAAGLAVSASCSDGAHRFRQQQFIPRGQRAESRSERQLLEQHHARVRSITDLVDIDDNTATTIDFGFQHAGRHRQLQRAGRRDLVPGSDAGRNRRHRHRRRCARQIGRQGSGDRLRRLAGRGRQSNSLRNPTIGPDEDVQPDLLRLAQVQRRRHDGLLRSTRDNTYTTLVASASLNVQTPGSPNLHNRDTVAHDQQPCAAGEQHPVRGVRRRRTATWDT